MHAFNIEYMNGICEYDGGHRSTVRFRWVKLLIPFYKLDRPRFGWKKVAKKMFRVWLCKAENLAL